MEFPTVKFRKKQQIFPEKPLQGLSLALFIRSETSLGGNDWMPLAGPVKSCQNKSHSGDVCAQRTAAKKKKRKKKEIVIESRKV